MPTHTEKLVARRSCRCVGHFAPERIQMGDRRFYPRTGKLLKFSELFGVTLDELVRGEEVPKTETAMPAAQTVPASFAPQATPEREKRRTIAGTVLLCTGAVILVFCLLLAGDPLTVLLFASPFLICGIICFAVKLRVGLCCGWAVYPSASAFARTIF